LSRDEAGQSESQQPRIEKLSKEHKLEVFDCGRASLNDWLKRFALINQQNDSARTYVLSTGNHVLGYYTLSAGAVRRDEAPARIAKGLASHPIGIILLARLAVESQLHGKGRGTALVHDALLRALAAADSIGARAVLVHALDESAAAFYGRFGFETSPVDAKRLMLLMKDLRTSLKEMSK
jgi:GNAT superfamily N-acetyltransferase